jgi:hypothetical protein
MKKYSLMSFLMKIIILILLFLPFKVMSQIDKVIVEKYYVTDANDATDTTGGYLEAGSVTYRIFIDLAPGCRLKKIYGDANHIIRFTSSAVIFNNTADGQSFANDFSKSRMGENTVALDSWLTIGQIIKPGAKTYFGVLKSQDDDGSFIGGINNDGGSAAIAGGLIKNTDQAAGIPPTVADGIDTMSLVPSNWADYGILDDSTNVDSTIFGSSKPSSEYASHNFGLQNSGVQGVNPDSNQVLIAQITTKGEITFELNVIIEEPASPVPVDVKYVAHLAAGEAGSDTLKVSPFLSYPLSCGCRDPHYLEYNEGYGCNIQDSCKTLVIYGCMDTLACNFDPAANFNISSLCCYPGLCNDRDISVVCPSLGNQAGRFSFYPNPAQHELVLQVSNGNNHTVRYEIYNTFGRLVESRTIGKVEADIDQPVNITNLKTGIYMIRMYFGEEPVGSKTFIKE